MLGCTVIPFGGGQTERQVQLIAFDPDIIVVTPSYMLNIADEMERQGVDHMNSLRLGIFRLSLGQMLCALRLKQEQTQAVDIYGLSKCQRV